MLIERVCSPKVNNTLSHNNQTYLQRYLLLLQSKGSSWKVANLFVKNAKKKSLELASRLQIDFNQCSLSFDSSCSCDENESLKDIYLLYSSLKYLFFCINFISISTYTKLIFVGKEWIDWTGRGMYRMNKQKMFEGSNKRLTPVHEFCAS